MNLLLNYMNHIPIYTLYYCMRINFFFSKYYNKNVSFSSIVSLEAIVHCGFYTREIIRKFFRNT